MPQYTSINKRINLHTLRHTAAVHMLTKMAENNFDINHSIYLLSVMLGHKTISETEIYLHLPYYEFNNFSCNAKLNSVFPKVKDDEE